MLARIITRILLIILSLLALSCTPMEEATKSRCCIELEQRVTQLQDKVNLYLDRFNSLHSLTSRFGRAVLERDFPECQFRQMIDEPLKFRVIRCPRLVDKYDDNAIDIFVEVYQETETEWSWRIREVDFARK